MHAFFAIWHWLLDVTGTVIPSNGSRWYNFWSGFGSDLGEAVIIGAVINWYRTHKCTSCFRLSHHDVAGTHFRTCHKHFTAKDHARLQKIHEEKYPEMHIFMKKDSSK
jgi:hypothetical protein